MSLTVGRPLAGPPNDHGHAHEHPHALEARPEHPSQGVVVDIGEGVGALVLHAGADREWLEPQIHPVDNPAACQHVWVLERIVASGSVYAAVFPSLREGRYGICSPDGITTQEVEIIGGKVTEARWT